MSHRVTGFGDRLLAGDVSSWVYVIIGAILVVWPFAAPSYHVGLMAEVLIFAIFATAFNLLYGYVGLLSFGHAMFLAVAGYMMANFLRTWSGMVGLGAFGGLEPLASLLVGLVFAVAITTLVAVFVGYLSVQLREIYFAMITLSFSMAIYVIANNDIGGLTNGSDGLTHVLGTITFLGVSIELMNILRPTIYYFIVLFFFLISLYVLWRIVNSPFGTVCKAIRENPGRSEALGIDVTRHSWFAFVISGAFSGLAGALLMPLNTAIVPSIAYWSTSAEPVLMAVIGGSTAFFGPAIGALTYEYLRWLINVVGLNAHWQLVFGTLLLLVVLLFEDGIAGGLKRLRDRLESGPESTNTDDESLTGDD